MKRDRVISKKTKNPGTGSCVHAQGSKHGNHDLMLDMIEKTGEVKKEYPAHPIGKDSVSSFEM